MTDRLQTAIDALDALTDEEFNQAIDYIRSTIKTRADRRNARARATMKVGTRVRLSGNRKPQYLSGLTGEIVEMRQSRVTVALDRGPIGKFKSGRVITQPGGLEVLS